MFDFKKPLYAEIFKQRIERLQELRRDKDKFRKLWKYYKTHPADFINDWGTTYDPRNPERGLPAMVPFILFPRQRELIEKFEECFRERKSLLVEKSRDVGISELTVAYAVAKCLFNKGFHFGFGSRKKEYVDAKMPRALLFKARRFIIHLPKEFAGDWNERKHSADMRIYFPMTQAYISGESGDNMGRGDRFSMYADDESAFHPHQELVDAALMASTNCRITLSTPCGPSNLFARKRFSGKIEVFSFPWYSDPRKTQEWFDKKKEEAECLIRFAQEYEMDYYGSIEGIIIPKEWIDECIDAHIKLGLTPSGPRLAGLDVSDQGADKNCFTGRQSFLLEYQNEWSGKGIDLMITLEKSMQICRDFDYEEISYDAVGLGGALRGDARVLNAQARSDRIRSIPVFAFLGSGKVIDPDGNPYCDRGYYEEGANQPTNKDYFANRKAQAWMEFRRRFQLTYRWIKFNKPCDPSEIISISSKIDGLSQLRMELSQARFVKDNDKKIMVDKKPDGTKSPNRADSAVICFAKQDKRRGLHSARIGNIR